MTTTETIRAIPEQPEPASNWIGWTPVAVLLTVAVACRSLMAPWVFMWSMSVAIFAGLKWLTWWHARSQVPRFGWRSLAYLLAWPGMNAEAFQTAGPGVRKPSARAWVWACLKTALGASLIWLAARRLPTPLAQGWVGMLGLLLLLHFGSFELISLAWRRLGVNAPPIMAFPLRSCSLSELWGERWNVGFRQFAHQLIFRPLQKRWGAGWASFAVFVASGLIHESVISLPARTGYGLPTAYFALQGVGVALERSTLGCRLGLRQGWRGWFFTLAIAAGPAFWLFHPWFMLRVMIPFLEAVHAL